MKDLELYVDNIRLNIRVAILIKTEKGYLIQKSKVGDYYFFIGGRIKINESSVDTVERELLEETNLKAGKIEFKSVMENFFIGKTSNEPVHELQFIYEVSNILNIQDLKLDDRIVEVSLQDVKNYEIKPEVLKLALLNEKIETHYILRDAKK